MKIYDRYNLDSSAEYQRYEERLAKVKHSLREDYDSAQNRALACYLTFLGLVIAGFLWGEDFPDSVFFIFCGLLGTSAVASLIMMIRMDKRGNDEEMDLYIYGMQDGRFLLLNPLYEEMGSIAPGKVREIRILAAMRPTSRQRHVHRRKGEITHFEYFGNKTVQGEIKAFPMAVLCSGENIDWRWIDDPIFRRQLDLSLTFVPLGDNADPFMYLLRESNCPVMVVPKIYEDYREQLDALFMQSDMDMDRIEYMLEDTCQAKMTKIIG